MPIFRLARRPSHAIRLALAALLLAIGLNAFAHAGHSHDKPVHASAAALHAGCGYCATFTGFADAPRAISWPGDTYADSHPSSAAAQPAPAQRTHTSATPRGPPHA